MLSCAFAESMMERKYNAVSVKHSYQSLDGLCEFISSSILTIIDGQQDCSPNESQFKD
jgi:hypothetical protein